MPCSVELGDASETHVEDEQALQTDAQEQAAPVVHDALSGDERSSFDRVLDVCYGIQWCLSALDLELPRRDVKITQSRGPYK